MAVIHELSSHLADLIAAGEVVERPASVAKELVENAIDAGAARITVEIENGGVTYLRIADDGCGIAPEDAPVAFRRHATSKLRTEEDLAAIGTLGFRGEALAAIASVSRIDLLTKQRGALAGTHLHLEAGQITEQEEAGCPEGTTLVIRDLFFNTPARMKFLKKDFTEAGYVMGVVQHAALSHPEIAFTLIRDGKQVFATAGNGNLMTPVFGVFGRELTEVMLEIEPFERGGVRVWGYITKPHSPRPNRSMQHFFVNNRYIKSKVMQAALEEAYRNKIITGKYPCCALFLSLPLHMVDVNVHPAKTEVKFAQEKQIFEAVYIACKNTERMIFNRLRQTEQLPVQQLLAPVVAELHAAQAGAVQEHIEEVRAAGFDIEPFGADSFAVRAAPSYLDSADIPGTLAEIAEKLLTSRAPVTDRLDDLIHMVACKAAIKAGSHSSMAELQSVCDRVLGDPEVTCCPHGRPVTVRLTRYELDKLFKRVNQ
uniref:DNA mismatch repair endonuclease MutL n=1 Tax=Intestinibacillus massiliensis TaxID=1871029 RepID=UPI000B361F7E|nr:DNA mismatch repair endonuclease MutL [Intestinibacillus massiliensis]